MSDDETWVPRDPVAHEVHIKRIAELEAENQKLREELQHRDGMNIGMVSTLSGKPFEYWFELESENAKLRQSNMSLASENAKLRRSLDNIKIRSYELGQRELHDMALAALEKNDG